MLGSLVGSLNRQLGLIGRDEDETRDDPARRESTEVQFASLLDFFSLVSYLFSSFSSFENLTSTKDSWFGWISRCAHFGGGGGRGGGDLSAKLSLKNRLFFPASERSINIERWIVFFRNLKTIKRRFFYYYHHH